MGVTSNHLTFEQQNCDPTDNPVGLLDEDIHEGYRVIYSEWRVEDAPLDVELWKKKSLQTSWLPLEQMES
jgi:hypothetical protein